MWRPSSKRGRLCLPHGHVSNDKIGESVHFNVYRKAAVVAVEGPGARGRGGALGPPPSARANGLSQSPLGVATVSRGV